MFRSVLIKVSLRLEFIGIIIVCFWKEKTVGLEILRQKKGAPRTKREQEKMDYRDREVAVERWRRGAGLSCLWITVLFLRGRAGKY